MDRRDFLSGALAAGAGSAAISSVGCAPALRQVPRETISDTEADEILARLSRALPATRDARLVSGIVRAERPAALAAMRDYLDVADDLASKALAGLVIGGTFGQIPSGKVANDRVKDRLLELAPELDEHVTMGTALLAQMPARQKADLDDIFRRQPEIPMRVGELLDRAAGDVSVAPGTRGKLRRLVAELSARARAQRFSIVCDEYLDKMSRIAAFHGDEVAFMREVSEHAAVASLYGRTLQVGATGLQAHDVETPPQRPPPAPITYGRPVPTTYTPPPPPPIRQRESPPGTGTLQASGYVALSGLGAFGLITLIGGIGGSVGAGVLIGATVGGILLILSLVLLIIGGLQRAAG